MVFTFFILVTTFFPKLLKWCHFLALALVPVLLQVLKIFANLYTPMVEMSVNSWSRSPFQSRATSPARRSDSRARALLPEVRWVREVRSLVATEAMSPIDAPSVACSLRTALFSALHPSGPSATADSVHRTIRRGQVCACLLRQ